MQLATDIGVTKRLFNKLDWLKIKSYCKGPVKIIKRVKIAHSFLQSVSDQFHVIILSLPM